LNYGNNLKKKLRLANLNFYLKNLRSVKKSYDIVSCTAALHHLKNPYRAISSLSKNTKPGGYLILSFGLLTSNFQHNLMKLISKLWGTNNNLIYKNTNILFSTHIKRCMKYGLRNKSNVIQDQFINSQHNYLDLKKIFKLLKNKFTIHSMWPKNFYPSGDSSLNNSFDENHELAQSNFYWASKGVDDIDIIKSKKTLKNYLIFKKVAEYFNNANYKKIKANYLRPDIYKKLKKVSKIDKYFYDLDKKTKSFFLEVCDLFNFLKDKTPSVYEVKKKLIKYRYLFKGTSGVGINYIILKKHT
jgi:SAM-dependent methyltransferase